jgi:hypothetical protein
MMESGLNWGEIEREWDQTDDSFELCSELDIDKLTPEVIATTRQEAEARGYRLIENQYGLSLERK